MTQLQLHLSIVGISLLALSLAHLQIARHLQWKKDLQQLTPINRQIFYVHAFFICLVLALMGVLCLIFPQTLLTHTPAARVVLGGLVIFWATRLIQFLVYDSSHWRGNRANTVAHIIAAFIWCYYTTVFVVAWWQQF